MFSLVTLTDVVELHPATFDKPSAQAIEDYLDEKYADKVIHQVGLCLGLDAIISTSEGLINHGSGIVHVNVDFQVVVFRPFKGEILPATITHSHPPEHPRAGITLSMDFFEDIVVPPETLFEGSRWNEKEGVWVWYQNGEEAAGGAAVNGTGESHDLTKEDGEEEASGYYFDRAEQCHFRVEQEIWQDLSPSMQDPGQDFYEREQVDEDGLQKTPYLIRGSMMHSGLGPMWWWVEGAQEEDGDGEAAAGDA